MDDQVPNVVALPLGEAREVLRRAGWECAPPVITRAPRQVGRPEAAAAVPPSSPGAEPALGELLVVRQQVLSAGTLRLTVAGHPGRPLGPLEPSRSGTGEESP